MLKRILEHSSVYSLWQSPFALRKFEPILRHNRMDAVRRVLDVGCGPGTNTHFFQHAEYLGIDWNARYVEAARRRHRRQFIAADVTEYRVEAGERFDFILVNSLLHHIDTDGTERLLGHLSDLLSDDGHIHILDLVLPEDGGISRRLAEWDRGDHPRPLGTWRRLFEAAFKPVLLEPYGVGAGGLVLWNMVYFKGGKRHDH